MVLMEIMYKLNKLLEELWIFILVWSGTFDALYCFHISDNYFLSEDCGVKTIDRTWFEVI